MDFNLIHSAPFHFTGHSSAPILVYASRKVPSFRVIYVATKGPLVSATMVIPTLVGDDKGLPHTLEHLIFCGSQSYPHRGYLDTLATQCLSVGTNAYTCEDHTGYTVVTAGGEG